MANPTKDFRRFYVNAFVIQVGDNEVSITLGTNDTPDKPDAIEKEATVYMTHRTMKILASNLLAIVENFERTIGEISVPAGKIDQVKELIEKQSAAWISKNKKQ